MDDNIIKGTGRWYAPSKGRPGKLSLKVNIAERVKFKNTQEVIVELNLETGVICIKEL